MRRGFVTHDVPSEVIRALTDGAHYAPGSAGRSSVERFYPMQRAVQGRPKQVVHARVDHEPAPLAADLGLRDGCDEHAVLTDARAPGFDDETQVAEARVLQDR